MVTQMTFMTPAELQEVRDTLETWSQLCLTGLDEMTYPGKSASQKETRRAGKTL
jgi:cell wall assembly regulator SMI1